MEIFVPKKVYKNLIKMLIYRGVEVKSEILAPDVIVQKLNHFEFITINGYRAASSMQGSAHIVIMLIAPMSKYSAKSADFKKLLKGLPKIPAGENLETIFVSKETLTIHIKKLLIVFREANPKLIIDSYVYDNFMINVPKHVLVPAHSIATLQEVSEYCHNYYTKKELFPRMRTDDVMAIWLGIRPGMVAKVIRESETAGEAVVFRICVRA